MTRSASGLTVEASVTRPACPVDSIDQEDDLSDSANLSPLSSLSSSSFTCDPVAAICSQVPPEPALTRAHSQVTTVLQLHCTPHGGAMLRHGQNQGWGGLGYTREKGRR